MAGEYLCLHIGQAGINIGNLCWELYCLEHGIQNDGTLLKHETNNNDNHKINSFFTLNSNDRYHSRSIFIDFEPDTIDKVKNLSHNFYHPQQFIYGQEDSGNNFARGFLNYESNVNESVLNRIQHVLEQCDNHFSGIQIINSMSGGTGSGFTSHILQELCDIYNNKLIVQQLSIIPSINISQLTSIEIYNTILALYYNILYCGLTVLYDNEAIYNIYDYFISNSNMNVGGKRNNQQPIVNYGQLNNIIIHSITKLTSTLRFQSTINKTMLEQQINLQITNQSDCLHFPIISYAPIISQKYNKFYTNNQTFIGITNSCLDSNNQLLKLKTNNSKMLNGCLIYAGNQNDEQIQFNNSILPNNYSQFKRGIVYQNIKTLPNDILKLTNKTALLLGNSLNIIDIWSLLLYKFKIMFKHKAFVHWYQNEGMDIELFETAYNTLKQLQMEYTQIIENKS